MKIYRFLLLVLPLLLGLGQLPAKEATWTGDPWETITRDRIVEIAEEMIDVTWSPRRTIHNYRSPTQPRTTFLEGQLYRGVAYNMIYEADDRLGFLGKVNNTPGGETSYGNDCSGFISIAWRLPRRLNTVRFEDEVMGPAILARSLGAIGSGASTAMIRADAFNRSGSHNILFDRYSSTGVISMEQTPGPRNLGLPHAEMRRNWSWSSLSQYRPIRRNLIEGELPPPPAGRFAPGDWVQTTASTLNLRAGPGVNFNVIGGMPRDTFVRILPHPNNGVSTGTTKWWYGLVYPGGPSGWMAESFLREASAPPGTDWAEVVVDNNETGFSASTAWGSATWAADRHGLDYRHRTTAAVDDPARWTVSLPYPGRYLVYAWWCVAPNRATAAPYTVEHAGGSTVVPVDQTQDGGKWNLLGFFTFDELHARVSLSPDTGSGDLVIADAVRVVALDPAPAGGLFSIALGTEGEGRVEVFPRSASLPAGTRVELNAVPVEGWDFVGWEGDFVGNSPAASFEIDRGMTVNGRFQRTFEAWQRARLTEEERQSGRTAPGGDFSGRGITNLAAYAFGLDPRAPEVERLPRVERTGSSSVFEFRRILGDPDLVYRVEASGDLMEWTELDLGGLEIEVLNDPEEPVEVVRVRIPDGGDSGLFLRLRLERAAGD